MKENNIKNERSSIKEAIKTMEHWVEYEKNNKDKINKADELINIQETILLEYKKILKENQTLKNFVSGIFNENIEKDFIPVQKVKDKIKEYKNILKTCNKAKDIDRIKAINERIFQLEDFLLEEREEK